MRIKWSALVSDVRGKLNGSVASKNRYGSYLRNKVTPTNPQTASQMRVRGTFGAISRLWGGLTDSQRKAWETFSQKNKISNIFGDLVTLQGNAMFQRCNMNLSKIDVPYISVPGFPLPPAIIEDAKIAVTKVDKDITVMDASVVFDGIPGEGNVIVVYATPPISAGRSFTKNELRLIAFGTVDERSATTEIDILNKYSEIFGTVLEDGEHIDARVAIVDIKTGIQSPPFPARMEL